MPLRDREVHACPAFDRPDRRAHLARIMGQANALIWFSPS